jgi:hypothetical protein
MTYQVIDLKEWKINNDYLQAHFSYQDSISTYELYLIHPII